MKIRALAAVLAAVSLLALAACDGDTPSLEQAQDAIKKAGETVEATAEKASGLLDNLDTEKVNELAKLAGEIQKDPSQASQLLEKAGMSKADFDAAVAKIQENPEMKKIFDAAKAMAAK